MNIDNLRKNIVILANYCYTINKKFNTAEVQQYSKGMGKFLRSTNPKYGVQSSAAFTENENIPDEVQKYLEERHMDLSRLYQELQMESRYVNTHQTKSVTAVGLHSHAFYEILYIRRGNIQYLLGTERYRIKQGDIIFIPPNVSHRALLSGYSGEPYERYVLWLSQEYVNQLRCIWPDLRLNDDCPRLVRTGNSGWEDISRSFQRGISMTAAGQPGWELEVIGNTTRLLVQLERLFTDTEAMTPERETLDLLDNIVEYIEHHLGEKITLEGVARHFLVSRSTISHTFQKRMEVSFYRFITQRRLIAAKNRILSEEAMNHVAEQVGFPDYSAFYRAFRQEYGVSPRDYAKLYAWQSPHIFPEARDSHE